ncbi:MAG: DUF3341 domain-containing protein [Flavobacteriales bacterium]
MAEKVIYALYDDDDTVTNAAEKLISKGVHINNVYSPFPVHNLDKVIGIKWTRLGICAFLFGLTGLTLAVWGIWYFMIYDWPMNIGGKPNFAFYQNLPAFIPIMFEFTVLCAAHGMAITFLIRNKTLPGLAPRNPDPRTTNNMFAVKIIASENADIEVEEIKNTFKETNAMEINEKKIDDQ